MMDNGSSEAREPLSFQDVVALLDELAGKGANPERVRIYFAENRGGYVVRVRMRRREPELIVDGRRP